MELTGAKHLSIYLGNICNFECTYCDRDYIKNTIGGQKMHKDNIDDIMHFVSTLKTEDGKFPVQMLNFHGGEPFVYVDVMDEILERIDAMFPGSDFPFYIQTNGSLILGNESFLHKWKDRLYVSISYDFLFQDKNRTEFDIDATLQALRHAGVKDVQFQFVIPIQERNAFSLDVIKSITTVCIKNDVRRINLIPLRHIRGKDKFRVIVDEIDLNAFFNAFIKFVEILYVLGLTVSIDGQEHDFDKHYFENHKQIILSPDGLIYPEYDFLEYKMHDTAVGAWKAQYIIPIKLIRDNPEQEDGLILPVCTTCEARDQCGLKFLYKAFGKEPVGHCKTFYQMVDIAIKHSKKLREHQTLLHSIGI